ncbi:MAG: cell division protein FtsL [Gammaproteobacteria bacterium]|nr:cell division protein FtsL [Gammaproteobacteria bacterium]
MRLHGDMLFAALLALAALASALAVVYARHEGRKLFIELQALQQVRDDMDVEWGQLQLEQSTWATHSRIDPIAREQLEMSVPGPDATRIIKQP